MASSILIALLSLLACMCGTSELQGYLDILACAVDVVAVECLRVASAQYAAFAARFAVVEAFPGF